MNNLKINQELKDQYVDASAALIMDQYTQRLSQKLEQEMESDNEYAELVCSDSLDQRCRQLIKDEYARIRRKRRLVTAKKILNRAAIIFVALLALSSVLFMTVDAIRIPIMNFFIEKQEESWHITGASQGTAKVESPEVSTFGFTNSYANRMPSDFSVVEILSDLEISFFGMFENSLGQTIRLSIGTAESSTHLDSENVDMSMDVLINNHPGVLLVEDETCRLAWIQDEVIIIIISKKMDYSDVISLAETISRPAQ